MKTSLEGQLAAPSLLEPVDRTLVNGLAELFEQLLVTVDHELFETASQNGMDPIQARLLMLLRDRGVQAELPGNGDEGRAQDLEQAIDRGWVASRGLSERQTFELTAAGRLAADRMDQAVRRALTELVAGYDRSQQLRLQGALHLLDGRLAPS